MIIFDFTFESSKIFMPKKSSFVIGNFQRILIMLMIGLTILETGIVKHNLKKIVLLSLILSFPIVSREPFDI